MARRPPTAGEALADFQRSVHRIGGSHGYLRDLYAAMLRARWAVVLGVFAIAYLLVNVVFALIYLAVGDSIAGARPGSFEDAFSFSVQTLSTVGYGVLSPKPPRGNVVVAIETFAGIMGVAVATGIVFNKFGRARAGVVLANRAVIGPRNGVPHLMLRVANSRGSDVVEATIRLTVIKNEVTAEGHRMGRLHDLKLERDTSPVLVLSWTVMHRIDETSPLHGITAEEIRDGNMRLFAIVTGIDGVFMQTVYAYGMYDHSRISFDAHYVDVLTNQPGQRPVVDLTKLDEVRPVTPPRGPPA